MLVLAMQFSRDHQGRPVERDVASAGVPHGALPQNGREDGDTSASTGSLSFMTRLGQ